MYCLVYKILSKCGCCIQIGHGYGHIFLLIISQICVYIGSLAVTTAQL